MSISYESIYKHIYRHRQSALGRKLIKLLPYHHHKRRNNRKSGDRVRIKDQVSIDNRPSHIELRLEAGHTEGDLMIRIGQKSGLATLVDRKTRYVYIRKIPDRKSKTVTQIFAQIFNNHLNT